MAVSPTHCRPGLAMTDSQLMEAKILILDLLGWGLSPENLVEAGISKYCLVPCLRELKLRLPTNIDLSDVVLYDPPIPTLESHMPSKVESNFSSNGTSPRAPNSSEQPAVTGDPA
ncbi:1759_t:CDS:2, partial [Acaulospora colombiana]